MKLHMKKKSYRGLNKMNFIALIVASKFLYLYFKHVLYKYINNLQIHMLPFFTVQILIHCRFHNCSIHNLL